MKSTTKQYDPDLDVNAHMALYNAKRFDLFRCADDRGFILVMNRNSAFFFRMEGDHFKYDGHESGPYAKGDIHILDNAPRGSAYP